MPFETLEILGAIAFLMRGIAGVIYVISIFKGQTKPHLYTWLVFTILTLIAFAAQISDGAGPGSWMMGITALSCLINAILALRFGEKNITRGDKIALATSLSAILPWLLTSHPVGSVILISLIDAVAMFPTLRKSWMKPDEENMTFHSITTLNVALSIFAIANITITTTLYPVSIILVNLSLIILCLWRRQVLKKAA